MAGSIEGAFRRSPRRLPCIIGTPVNSNSSQNAHRRLAAQSQSCADAGANALQTTTFDGVKSPGAACQQAFSELTPYSVVRSPIGESKTKFWGTDHRNWRKVPNRRCHTLLWGIDPCRDYTIAPLDFFAERSASEPEPSAPATRDRRTSSNPYHVLDREERDDDDNIDVAAIESGGG
jgi:hypothetical protein